MASRRGKGKEEDRQTTRPGSRRSVDRAGHAKPDHVPARSGRTVVVKSENLPAALEKIARQAAREALRSVEDACLGPLPLSEFESVLAQLHELGVTWAEEYPLRLKPIDDNEPERLKDPRLLELQRKFPYFPTELNALLMAAFLGIAAPPQVVGDAATAEAKARVVADRVVSQELKDSFFFKHAIKVPRLAHLDWEIVVKQAEQGVQGVPSTAYALLSLRTGSASEAADTCFAADERLLRDLIESAEGALRALESVKVAVKGTQLGGTWNTK